MFTNKKLSRFHNIAPCNKTRLIKTSFYFSNYYCSVHRYMQAMQAGGPVGYGGGPVGYGGGQSGYPPPNQHMEMRRH